MLNKKGAEPSLILPACLEGDIVGFASTGLF
jgi:hypothetical protein